MCFIYRDQSRDSRMFRNIRDFVIDLPVVPTDLQFTLIFQIFVTPRMTIGITKSIVPFYR